MNLTNYGENRLADKVRGTEPLYPASWYIALGSAADDASFTEITGADLPRVAVARSAAAWAATNGPGTIVNPSTGSGASTSNNDDIEFSASASDRGSAAFVGLFDAASGGNCWAWIPMPGGPITVNSGDAPIIAAGGLALTMFLANGATRYLQNKMVDEFFRGQAYAWPVAVYGQLFSGGAELAGFGYGRFELESSMTAILSTQGNTSASSGSGGRVANASTLTYPVPSGDWFFDEEGLADSAVGGNTLMRRLFASSMSAAAGNAPSHAPNTLGITFK